MALVLISTLPWVEAWFNGIDRAATGHRHPFTIAGATHDGICGSRSKPSALAGRLPYRVDFFYPAVGTPAFNPRELSVFMLTAVETQWRHAGVASRNIHREYFDWR